MKIEDLIRHHKQVISVLERKRATQTINDAFGIAFIDDDIVVTTHTDSEIGHHHSQIAELQKVHKILEDLGCSGKNMENAESFYLSSINLNASWGIPLYDWILKEGIHGEGVTFTLIGRRSRTVTMSVSFCWGKVRIHYLEWGSLKDVSWSLDNKLGSYHHIDLANHLVRRAVSHHSRMTDDRYPLGSTASFYNRLKKEGNYDPFLHKTTLRDPLTYIENP